MLDWQTDFIAGRSILEQIHAAAARCSANVFLFTKDDDLIDYRQPNRTAPRDNLVLEAGYVIALKGKRNVLIVREEGSEMPTDLGRDVYARLRDKSNIGPIERFVSTFVAALWRRGRRYVSHPADTSILCSTPKKSSTLAPGSAALPHHRPA